MGLSESRCKTRKPISPAVPRKCSSSDARSLRTHKPTHLWKEGQEGRGIDQHMVAVSNRSLLARERCRKKGGQLTVDGEVNPAVVVVPSIVREGQRSESEEGKAEKKRRDAQSQPTELSRTISDLLPLRAELPPNLAATQN